LIKGKFSVPCPWRVHLFPGGRAGGFPGFPCGSRRPPDASLLVPGRAGALFHPGQRHEPPGPRRRDPGDGHKSFAGLTRLQVVAEDVGGAAVIAEAGESLSRFVDFPGGTIFAGSNSPPGFPALSAGNFHERGGLPARDERRAGVDFPDGFRGQISERKIEDTACTYRSMGLKKGEVILGGKFVLQRGKGEETRARVEEILRAVSPNSPTISPARGRFSKTPARAGGETH